MSVGIVIRKAEMRGKVCVDRCFVRRGLKILGVSMVHVEIISKRSRNARYVVLMDVL